MQRYFINTQLNDTQFVIGQDDLHHIKKVMRNKNGDQVIVVDSLGQNILCTIIDVDQGILQQTEILDQDNELDIDVTLAYAMPKGDKFELVLQKACELGVKRIVPMISSRCVVKLSKERFDKKKIRYQKILKEASEQSCRNFIPEITDLVSIQDIMEYACDYNLIAYEEISKIGEHGQLKKTLDQIKKGQSLMIIVGSEGGFDQQEVDQLIQKGVKACSLGRRILRSETAPLYMMSVIGYSREVK